MQLGHKIERNQLSTSWYFFSRQYKLYWNLQQSWKVQITDVGTLIESEERKKKTWLVTAALTTCLLWGVWWQDKGVGMRILLAKKSPDDGRWFWNADGQEPSLPHPFHIPSTSLVQSTRTTALLLFCHWVWYPIIIMVPVIQYHHSCPSRLWWLYSPHLICPNYKTTLAMDSFSIWVLFSQSEHNHNPLGSMSLKCMISCF